MIRRALWVAALGAAQALATTYPAWWPLALLAMAGLVASLQSATPRQAALLGWLYGTAWLGSSVWWLFISLHRYGGLPAPLAVLAVALLCGSLALYLAAACAAWARWRTASVPGNALRFAALWLLAEWARAVWFTGFPWAASGYSQVDGPLAVLAPWVGVNGIGAVLALLAGMLGPALHGAAASHQTLTFRSRTALLVSVGLLLALPALLLPREFTQPVGSLRVALVQTQVAQDEKFAAERMPAALAWLSRTLHEAQADLVLAPETAVPLLPAQLSELLPGWWEALQAHFAQPGRALLVGLPLGDFQQGYTNSVVGLAAPTPAGAYRYDKHHLVPFGEFVPPGFRWFTQLMNIPLGDFERGRVDAPSFVLGAQRIAPNICYEDLFGEELAVRFLPTSSAPTILANVSNIGWFGDTVAISQHLNITRMRTLEVQRPMLRATNTGATAIVDHRGRVTQLLPNDVRGVLEGTVEGRGGVTPYAAWAGRFGWWPLVGAAMAVLLVSAGFRRAAARRAPAGPAAPR